MKRSFTLFMILMPLSCWLSIANAQIRIPEPVPPSRAIRVAFDLDPFYQQWIDVKGFPVLASANVNPYTVKEAAWLISKMFEHRPDILGSLAASKQRFTIIAHNEHSSEIPEIRNHLTYPIHFEAAYCPGCETIYASEENILYSEQVPRNSILIHEMAHGAHLAGLDATFNERLKAAYHAAMRQGLWQGTYASTNPAEYWADGAMYWFGALSSRGIGINRDELKTYDQALAGLLTEVFGDGDWRYTAPATRTLFPHLQGFSPQDAPSREWPPELRDPKSDSDGKWVDLPLQAPSRVSQLRQPMQNQGGMDLFVVNHLDSAVSLHIVAPNETRIIRLALAHDIVQIFSGVGTIWLVKKLNGSELGVFQTGTETGRVLIGTPVPEVKIPDPNLATVVRKALGLGPNALITQNALQGLTALYGEGENQIKNLTGLEYATGLTRLSLSDNQIRDVTPLAGLTQLRVLDLQANRIQDITGLRGLAALQFLLLEHNQIRDVSALTGLTQLWDLRLNGNPIEDKAPLRTLLKRNPNLELDIDIPQTSGLIPDPNLAKAVREALDLAPNASITKQEMRKLTKLTANDWGIEDLTGLEHATQLEALSLTRNQIEDVSPLAGLTKLKSLSLNYNRIRGTGPLLVLLKNNPDLKLDITIPMDEHPPMYWLTGATFRQHKDGSETISNPIKLQRLTSVSASVETLWESSSPFQSSASPQLAVDRQRGKFYWTERIGESQTEIKCINLHGDPNVEKLATVNSILLSIAVDPKRRKLYWINSRGRIQRANLNGKQIRTIVENRNAVGGITLDAEGGKLYWTEGLSILQADLNGKNIQNVLTASSRTGKVHGISSITIAGRKIYWLQSENDAAKYYTDRPASSLGNVGGRILHANLDGSGIKEIFSHEILYFSDFVLDAPSEALYCLKGVTPFPASQHILRLDFNTSEAEVAVHYGAVIGGPETLALGASLNAVAAAPVNNSLLGHQIAVPDATGLLPNYPNPFNPETWIPYQLSKPTEVTLHIYAVNGTLIRTLELGHQVPGTYQSKSRAAYWDGRNALGEPVASGVYFYTLTAGEFTVTRRMLILK